MCTTCMYIYVHVSKCLGGEGGGGGFAETNIVDVNVIAAHVWELEGGEIVLETVDEWVVFFGGVADIFSSVCVMLSPLTIPQILPFCWFYFFVGGRCSYFGTDYLPNVCS